MTESNGTSHFPNLPVVSRETLRALIHDIATDPTYSQRVFRRHNNHNNDLMSGIVVAANEQAKGDMRLQDSFVKGAEYVLAALQRELDAAYLGTLWEEEQAVELQATEESPNAA